MKRGIGRRIAELERRRGRGRDECYLIGLPDAMDQDDALAALEIAPGPSDVVVFFWHSGNKTQPELLNRYALVR